MPHETRPQRKAAAVARERLAQGNRTNNTKQPDKPADQKAPAAADGARPKAEPMKREEGQTERDKQAQEKKEEGDSTAPLPEKVSRRAWAALAATADGT